MAVAYRLCEFRTATRSQPPDKDCVDIARGHGLVVIRDTKQDWGSATDAHVVLSAADFDEVQHALRDTDVRGPEIPSEVLAGCVLRFDRQRRDHTVLTCAVDKAGDGPSAPLVYTDAEIVAWLDGVANHEFDQDTIATQHDGTCQCDGLTLAVA